MRNQPPESVLSCGWPYRPGGLLEHENALNGRGPLEIQVALLVPKRQARRQVAVGARQPYGDRIDIGSHGLPGQVYQGKINIDGFRVTPRGGPTVPMPERLLLVAYSGMPVRVERLELDRIVRRRIHADDVVH